MMERDATCRDASPSLTRSASLTRVRPRAGVPVRGPALGGGMHSNEGNATLIGVIISNCSATTTGDGIAVGGGVFSIQGSLK